MSKLRVTDRSNQGFFLKWWDNSLEADTDVLKKLFAECRGLQGEWRSASVMWISKIYCRPYHHVTVLLLLKIRKSIRTHMLHCAVGSVVNENSRCNVSGMLIGVHLQQEMFPFCLHAAVPVSCCHDYLLAFIHWSCADSTSVRALSWRDVRVTAYIWALLTTMPCFEDQCASAASDIPPWDLSSIQSMIERGDWVLLKWSPTLIWTEELQIRPWNVQISVW